MYFQRAQHAGANSQTIAGWVGGVPVVMLGLALGTGEPRHDARQIDNFTPVAGTVVSLCVHDHHIWQSVVSPLWEDRSSPPS